MASAPRKRRRRTATKAEVAKDEVVRFRVTKEQKAQLEEAAQRDGLDVSNWLRRLGLKAAGALPEAEN